jgi:peroxin-2
MPESEFAAAQARLASRRQQREQQLATRVSALQASSSQPSRLPRPLRTLGDATFSAWDAVRGRGGTRPAFRVGQVDAELLDEELLELLKGQAGEALKYYGVRSIHKFFASSPR